MLASVLEGVAMKKVLMAKELPGPGLVLVQLGPTEFVLNVGENTQ
jgi:hypothetical protein